MRIEIYKDAVHTVLREPDGLVYPFMDTVAKRIIRKAKVQVGVDTSALKNSIRYTIRGGTPVFVKITAHDYKAMMHHEGTKPHVIRASKGKTLKIGSGSRVTYIKQVNHPGTKPNRYLTDSMSAVISSL